MFEEVKVQFCDKICEFYEKCDWIIIEIDIHFNSSYITHVCNLYKIRGAEMYKHLRIKPPEKGTI